MIQEIYFKKGKFYSNQRDTKVWLCTQDSPINYFYIHTGILLYSKYKEYPLTGKEEYVLNFSNELDDYTEFKGSLLITSI